MLLCMMFLQSRSLWQSTTGEPRVERCSFIHAISCSSTAWLGTSWRILPTEPWRRVEKGERVREGGKETGTDRKRSAASRHKSVHQFPPWKCFDNYSHCIKTNEERLLAGVMDEAPTALLPRYPSKCVNKNSFCFCFNRVGLFPCGADLLGNGLCVCVCGCHQRAEGERLTLCECVLSAN